ncbi:MAG TPA: hypothetical protein VK745_27150 [Polyangiaceae bacterium]|jgi:hypothetical protein|nr:hypothetical protein [Polyangiaceae bacterium]
MSKSVFVLACAVLLTACPMPPPASERATDAARDANIAARFGRIDIAAGSTTNAARDEFLRRRATWGGDIRIVDVELGGLSMPDSDHAVFQVDFAWMRMDEDTLRSTRVAQRWTSSKGSWVLESEKRVAGDIGLFGERVQVLRPPQRDAQFATKVIRED